MAAASDKAGKEKFERQKIEDKKRVPLQHPFLN